VLSCILASCRTCARLLRSPLCPPFPSNRASQRLRFLLRHVVLIFLLSAASVEISKCCRNIRRNGLARDDCRARARTAPPYIIPTQQTGFFSLRSGRESLGASERRTKNLSNSSRDPFHGRLTLDNHRTTSYQPPHSLDTTGSASHCLSPLHTSTDSASAYGALQLKRRPQSFHRDRHRTTLPTAQRRLDDTTDDIDNTAYLASHDITTAED